MENDSSPYESLSDNQLVGYYLFILTNIHSGKLSNAMFGETEYIESVAAKRGLYFTHKENVYLSPKNHPILVTVTELLT
ncbi:hypothetical protein [Halobacillus sp. A5]|uniref:hypothetical protein n=1 Tax=Halobacillus sp. A5 TaxID=2880263 RepID=UPI0020A64BEC|nr:hypothetical protein [Halobacillus sp. A5]MCP3028763.1 hypothetical protein [Halobacillus sp. A5]